MENFSDFDQQGIAPRKDAGSIISHTFDNYKGILGYSLVAFLIYIVISMIVSSLLSFFVPGTSEYNSQIMDMVKDAMNGKKFDVEALNSLKTEMENARSFSVIAIEILTKSLTAAIITPLVVGIIYLAQKFNTKQNLDFGDLFIGYRQNTANIFIYGFVSSLLIYTGLELYKLPGIYLSIAFFLGLPILFFENTNAIDAMKKSFHLVNANFMNVGLVWLVMGIIAVSGALLCGVGIMLTFPIFYATRYSVYAAICGTPKQIDYKP